MKKKGIVREYIEAFAGAIVLALIIRTFVVQAFKIPSGSMEDTLLVGDHILVNKFIYGDASTRRPAHPAASSTLSPKTTRKYALPARCHAPLWRKKYVKSVMPAHKDFLGPERSRLIAAYVWGLSQSSAGEK